MATNTNAPPHPRGFESETAVASISADEQRAEAEQARHLAQRYRLDFLDMDTFRIDQDLFRSIPADLMLRYGFVPHRRVGKALEIVVSDPTDLPMIDELAVLLATPIKVAVGPKSAIQAILKKSESSQRMPGKPIEFRVSIMPSVHGEDSVIRILDKESISEQFTELRLDILGFPEDELRRFRKYIREPYGMVLVTGPTGSGKTTTLYAALSEIKSIEDKIVTIEDPVEYQLRAITKS